VSIDTFRITSDCWALRVRSLGVDKGQALERLARARSLRKSELVAVGNDYNDLPLFRVAGQSFAMGDAPLAVRKAAHHVLGATSLTGGGVAEALAHLAKTT
jgi:hydroxymethylpyrimidine pyrophosphatase-like HAD family hydrolase